MSADQIAALLEQSSDGDPFEIPKDDEQSPSPSIIFADEKEIVPEEAEQVVSSPPESPISANNHIRIETEQKSFAITPKNQKLEQL